MSLGSWSRRDFYREVAQAREHGLASDIHSLAMTLYEICTLHKPYSNAISTDFINQLLDTYQERPPLHRITSAMVQDLLTVAWHPDPSVRPDIETVNTIVRTYTTQQ